MKHQPERTCIGCRGVFSKDEVVRIVAGPSEIVIDYREKLPGRAAYVCPRMDCIKSALSRENLAKALRTRVSAPSAEAFVARLAAGIEEKIKSLVIMSAKAGKLAAGYSAVRDALEKGRLEMILYAQDLSEGTKEKLTVPSALFRRVTMFSRDELGRILNRELVGVIGIEDKGLAEAVWKETERLKDLINSNE